MRDADLVARTTALLDAEAAAGRFSGAALLARGSEPLLAEARGYAIEPRLLANERSTRFNIASVTKMLTATGVLQLAARGMLALDAPVVAYNPALPHAGQVTIHQLLTHTAGFDRYWNDAYRAARSDLRTVNDYVNVFAGEPLLFEPGLRHHYGNTGYVLLGAVIEAVTGASYYDYMREAIFEPAGMQTTDFFELDLPHAACATGYTLQNWPDPPDGQLRANTFMYAVKGSPSEHCYSTVHDLFRFFEALRSGRLLDPAYLGLALTPHCHAGPGVSYGYGFHIVDHGAHGQAVGHGGRAMGADAFAMWYRDLGYTVVVLANYDRPAARRILDAVAGWLLE